MNSLALLACVLIASITTLSAADATNVSLRLETQHAIDKGLRWLMAQRHADGYWSEAEQPALTALALSAILGDPSRDRDKELRADVNRSLDWLVSNAKRDGGIYGKGLANYNTAVSMMALLLADRPQDQALILKARRFVTNLQQDYGERGKIDHALDGGVGYGSSYAHSDLSNTHLALEALHYSKGLLADKPEEQKYELDWDAAIAFVSKCQNLPGSNSEDWASDDPDNKGGFIYFPGDSKAGEQTLATGKVALRSYGSMGYAGLLAFIYADLDKADPRYTAVMEWLSKNYTVEENPGMGTEGLFYYYHTMAKALSLTGANTLKTFGGEEVRWREPLCKKLFDHQRTDGSWMNETKRWWEGDAILSSTYALLALEHVARGL
jgi:squalene-hopene/tetraprenyl-beta-curcumene cyclase